MARRLTDAARNRRAKLLNELRRKMEKATDERLTNDYETLQRQLRLLMYGCYSKKDRMNMLQLKDRAVRNQDALLKTILPADMIMETGCYKKKRVQIKSDSYRVTENYLAEMYMIEQLQGRDIYLYMAILRILDGDRHAGETGRRKGFPNGRACTANAISDIICGTMRIVGANNIDDAKDKNIDADYVYQSASIRAAYDDTGAEGDGGYIIDHHVVADCLAKLVRCGLVEAIPDKKRVLYRLAEDVLDGCTPAEMNELRFAIDFYRNIAPLAVPGYYLSALIAARMGEGERSTQPFQYANMDLRRILDDESAYALYMAAELGRRQVSFYYRDPAASDRVKKGGTKSETRRSEHCATIMDFTRKQKQLGDAEHVRRREGYISVNHFTGRQQLVTARGEAYRLDGMSFLRYVDTEQQRPEAAKVVPHQAEDDRQEQRPADVRGQEPHSEQGGAQVLQPRTMMEKKTSICLRFHYEDETRAAALQRSLRSHLLGAEIWPEGDGTFRCTIENVRDTWQYVPILRQYLPRVEVLAEGAPSLRRHIAGDIEEMLRSYDD